jgi:hypothetical protein
MSKRTLGSLADLAKILEQAVDPTSTVREDRQTIKAKSAPKKSETGRISKVIDPKRKAWYERRLRQASDSSLSTPMASGTPEPVAIQPEVTKAAASMMGGTLMQVLAEAKSPKQSHGDSTKRPEAWRRKPGDPLF